MTTSMGPPPPRSSTSSDSTADAEPEHSKTLDEEQPSHSTSSTKPPLMPPPPPKIPDSSSPSPNPNDPPPEPSPPPPEHTETATAVKESTISPPQVPYTIPPWSHAPKHEFHVEVLKDGSIIDQLNTHEKGAYMFGRVDLCDFVLEHPTVSRFHAVDIVGGYSFIFLENHCGKDKFNKEGDAYIYDLGSTHGTSVNKAQIKKKLYVELHVGDVIRFGQSSRLYIFQGPSDLMLPEKDLQAIRDAKAKRETQDRENSLRRAREEASLADGISWGMGEDAVEEEEDDADEVTWQTYKGQLTEKQEKTREKLIKRTQKIAHMKKEIDAIRSKDIAQGGLTQGQQTQIARNEQRIAQILEELENLEETLNESIRESIGGRSGKLSRGRKKGSTEEDDDFLSDDDEFYDRTKKKPSVPKSEENQTIETAETLLDKRDAIMKKMEDKNELLLNEKKRMQSGNPGESEAGDSLDAYMSGLSSQLIHDKAASIEKEISSLQSELDRIGYLLKFADPTGEASKRRTKREDINTAKSENSVAADKKVMETKKKVDDSKFVSSSRKEQPTDPTAEKGKKQDGKIVGEAEGKSTVYTVVKPQWLGAVENLQAKETQKVSEVSHMHDSDQFVDYKDRKKILGENGDSLLKSPSGNEGSMAGLIIRKRKLGEEAEDKPQEQSNSSYREAELKAEDAVALLLKHEKGYYAVDAEGNDLSCEKQSTDVKKPKRVLGPEKPSFLNARSDYESWVPPEGQSGDGRTSLNDRFGY